MSAAAQSPLQYFGRAWRIELDTADGSQYVVSSDQFSEALRATFTVEMYALQAYGRATVTLYNLDNSIAGQVAAGAPNVGNLWKFNQAVTAGNTVKISAGYKQSADGAFDPGPSLIYTGTVFQPIWTRENVVDYKLILRCVTALFSDMFNFASFPVAGGSTAFDILTQLCSPAKANIPIENIDAQAQQKLSQATLPRAQGIHGRPGDIIRQTLKQQHLLWWISPNGLNIRSFSFANAAPPDFSYGPPNLPGSNANQSANARTIRTTLIGVPEQTQQGVLFRVLLDSDVKIGSIVKLAPGTIINAYQFQYGSGLPAVPNQTGTYVVVGVRHFGDTRGGGDDWYTEVNALTMDFFANWLGALTPGQVAAIQSAAGAAAGAA